MARVEGIIADVCSNGLQFGFVANDMIVETLLPELIPTNIASCFEMAKSGSGCE